MLYALEMVETQLCSNDTGIVWRILKWISAMGVTGKVQAGRSSLESCVPKGLQKRAALVHSCAPISRTCQSEEVHVREHS